MAFKPIRDAASYEAAVERLEELADAKADTPAGDEADVLSTLIDVYENQNAEIEKPSAIEAIKFRMDQLDLKPRDLVPDIGSKSRVSEVLSGQRPLTVDMIRSLHKRWDIPLASLVDVDGGENLANPEPSKPVIKRLKQLGVLKDSETYHAFRSRICKVEFGGDLQAAYRRRTTPTADLVALDAWCVATIAKSMTRCPAAGRKDISMLNKDFLREIAKCSARSNGAIAARDMLAEAGVCFVVLPHFPGTHLDGSAMTRPDGMPIAAVTLRHDRIDNFWFTLLHECSHIALKHVGSSPILDDLEIRPTEGIEAEADAWALDALVPSDLWQQLNANAYTSTVEILDLAHAAGVHPAIVAGVWRKEQNNYRRFSTLLGHGTMKKQLETEID